RLFAHAFQKFRGAGLDGTRYQDASHASTASAIYARDKVECGHERALAGVLCEITHEAPDGVCLPFSTVKPWTEVCTQPQPFDVAQDRLLYLSMGAELDECRNSVA